PSMLRSSSYLNPHPPSATLLPYTTLFRSFKVLLWNVLFAGISVISTFLLGMFLALLMNDDRLRGKGLYRSLLILPYALPVYVTALVWASMFNQDFGLINNLLGLDINWLGDGNLAKVAILLTNLWLG